ncbi:serine/threonine-protein kinase [Paracidobacterium acidisoli]|nr:serine/threonine-protein kinase [Paracidobacterium acidisoli]MBT9332392.1 protein kinase [Paracidobacterium acidisoli]
MHDDPTRSFDGPVTAPAGLPPGRDTWGDFRLLARVGHGGFGEVYRAWDPHLEREVALKLLLPGSVNGEAEYSAILREARALAAVQHANIVHVYGIDRHDGRVGFWTDFVHGKTLSVLLEAQGPFGYREAALIGLDVAKALSAVHRTGILHRDIKTENVMREEGGRILLMDFGLSALPQRLTGIAGTPNYMAPELFTGHPATVASDIYAMGVLLYHLVTGEYPARLSGITPAEAADAIGKRKPLLDVRPDIPEPFLKAVNMAMEVDPAKRFGSAGHLAAALTESLGASVSDNASGPKAGPAPRRKMLFPAAGVAAIILAVAALAGMRSESLRRWLHLAGNQTASVVPANVSDEFLKAQDLLQHSYKGANLAAAVTGFQQVLQKDPSFALAEAGLGSAYFGQFRNSRDPKLLDQATEHIDKALQLDPNLASPYVTQARIAAMEGHTSLAMQQIEKAISLDPHNAEAYGSLAEIYKANGRLNDSFTALQKAIDLAPDDSRWPLRLGSYQFGAGNLQEAVRQLQSAISLAPDNATAYFDLGVVDMQLDKLPEAKANLEKSLALDPYFDTYQTLGTLAELEGRFSDAVAMYRKAIDLNPNSYETWGNLGSAYLWSGAGKDKTGQAYRKAIEIAEAERKKTPEDARLLGELANYYASIGNKTQSSIFVRQSLAFSNDDPAITYRAGETYEILGQREKAIPLIAESVTRGYDLNEFQRSPELASLRSDPAFQAALVMAKTPKMITMQTAKQSEPRSITNGKH